MVKIIKSAERYHANHGWLDTHWHFSFGDYYDPNNVNFSALRVFNDDVVGPHSGFEAHPHRDMEIITYVLDGELSHEDSAGHRGVIAAGEVQVMSAGTGILHSEKNDSDRPVHLLQIWIMPRKKGNTPRWEQRQFTPEQRSGRLLAVVSSGDVPETLTIDQDARVYVSRLAGGESVKHQAKGSHAYLFLISGRARVNGKELLQGDQARMMGERDLEIAALEDSEIIVLDLP